MPYGKEWAECPRCGKRAKDKDEIEEKFGYRDMGDGRHIPQSHCGIYLLRGFLLLRHL